MGKLNVAILGATGAVGQRFIQLLENHPWFRVAEVNGSERSAGRTYGEAVRWVLDGEPPASVRDLTVKATGEPLESRLVFSALPKETAVDVEVPIAAAGHVVCTNASAFRMTPDVPLLLPEINSEHIRLLEFQRRNRGWTTGALVANSNCTTMPVVMSLAPLMQFGVRRVSVVSAQAISGAGYPGVPSLDILDNIVPFVGGEEDKLVTEPRKMLGRFTDEAIAEAEITVSASCNRAPVIDGHLVNISVELTDQPSMDEVIAAWNDYRGADPVPSLPSAPAQPVIYVTQEDRPQPRRDRMAGSGMSTTVGRLRECPVLGYKFVALSHNTIRGAAGCSILNAELLAVEGFVSGFQPLSVAQAVV